MARRLFDEKQNDQTQIGPAQHALEAELMTDAVRIAPSATERPPAAALMTTHHVVATSGTVFVFEFVFEMMTHKMFSYDISCVTLYVGPCLLHVKIYRKIDF